MDSIRDIIQTMDFVRSWRTSESVSLPPTIRDMFIDQIQKENHIPETNLTNYLRKIYYEAWNNTEDEPKPYIVSPKPYIVSPKPTITYSLIDALLEEGDEQ